MEVTLQADDEKDIRRAAMFIAELVRQGVTFKAREDIVTTISGITSERGIVVTLTGGY